MHSVEPLLVPGDVPVAAELAADIVLDAGEREAEALVKSDRCRVGQRDSGEGRAYALVLDRLEERRVEPRADAACPVASGAQ